MSVGMMTFGSIFDYFGPRRAFAIFLIGSAVMVYVLALAQNMASLLVIGAVMGFFSNGMFGGYGAVISRLYLRKFGHRLIISLSM
jgi:MFS family permease